MEYLHGGSCETANTELAAALGVLVPVRDGGEWVKVLEGDLAVPGRRTVTFYFEGWSADGDYETAVMIRAWDTPSWHEDYPRHALAYLRTYFRNVQRLNDFLKGGVRIAAAWRGGKLELFTWRGEKPRGHEMVPGPAAGMGCVEVDEVELACALMAVGVPLWMDKPWRLEGKRPVFRFHAGSPDGKLDARVLSLVWQEAGRLGEAELPAWCAERLEHPFTYVLCGKRNFDFAMAEVRRKAPVAVMMKDGFPCFLGVDADPEVEGRFMRELKR